MVGRNLWVLFLVALIGPAARCDDRKRGWFEGMLHPPAVTLALPTNFIVVSASPESKTTKEFNMYDGVIWAPERTARQYEFGADKKFSHAHDPLFHVHLSDNVGQEPGTDSFNIEKNLEAMFAPLGGKKIKSNKTKWGTYPVLSLTGERPDGSPIFVAWVGINSPDGWAVLIDYRVPHGKGHPTADEKKIWETFLSGTKAQ